MAHRPNKGQPIQIVQLEGETSFSLDADALQQLLLADDVKNLPVVVVSVAGKFREGKSFLLNFFLRYMRNWRKDDWMADPNAPLEGFSWRGGSNRETTGIWMWNEVFVVTTDEGRKVAVIFLDSQGTFDGKSTVNGSAMIFAFSMMASTVQIYNISQNIGEDHLQNLQLFAKYGCLALKETGKKPFQKLVFLVRDWPYAYEREYGFAGGKSLVTDRLRITEEQKTEQKNLRSDISSCFAEISGFLMPHPGQKVTSEQTFDGRLSDIDDDFKKQLRVLVSSVLRRNNLEVKNISGCDISCKELLHHLEVYARMFKSGSLPEAKSMFEASVEANNSTAVDRAVDMYRENMEKVFQGDRPYVDTDSLYEKHQEVKESALDLFKEQPKLGGETRSKPHKDRLEKVINQQFMSFFKRNEGERIKADEKKIMDDAHAKAKRILGRAQASATRMQIACCVSNIAMAAAPLARSTVFAMRAARAVSAASALYGAGEGVYALATQESTSDED